MIVGALRVLAFLLDVVTIRKAQPMEGAIPSPQEPRA